MAVLLSLQNVSKEFSGETLFSPVSFMLKEHDRMAILGPNGSGKSTLLKIILGKEEPTSGEVIIPKGVKIGYLSQDVISDPENTLYEEIMTAFAPVLEAEKKLHDLGEALGKDSENEALLEDYSKAENRFLSLGGYDYRYEVSLMLNMFSFRKEDYKRKISSFSGGEKTRLAFAKLLLLKPDLLIMDEPTNHLDIISIEWLEDYLSKYPGAVLFVSHDIAFVRKLAQRILDIDNHVYTLYNATYDNFAKMKKDHYENLLEQYKAQEEKKEKLVRFITFYMPKPRFASRAKDRVKKLERLEKNAISDPSKVKKRHLSIGLSGYVREGKKLIDFKEVSIGYDAPLVKDITFTLYGQDHLALMGANGTGKSTFGKVLLNELHPLSGEIRRYFHLSMGILRQDIRSYQDEETLFEYFRNRYPRLANEDIYAGLSQYAFSYEESNKKKLSSLSGGELMRLEILNLSLKDYDLLILDEPTNHLDMMSISELIDALNQYEGTLLIISHDRDFVDKTCNKLLYLYEKKAYYYEGNYEAFRNERLKGIMDEEKKRIEAENATEKEKSLAGKKAKNEAYQEEKKQKRRSKESPEKILEKIDRLEGKEKTLTDECGKEEVYSDPEKLKAISEELSSLKGELEKLYAQLDESM